MVTGLPVFFTEAFFLKANAFPASLALGIGGKRYTYRELLDCSGGIAEKLRSLGELPVWTGILAQENMDTYASILALWSLGRGYVPLSPHQPVSRNATILRESGAKILLVGTKDSSAQELADLAPDIQIIHTRDCSPAPYSPPVQPCGEDPAYLLFTSGSSGTPKGVMVTQGNISAFLSHMLDPAHYQFSPDDRFLMMFEPTFDASMMSFLVALSSGASFFVTPRKGLINYNVIREMEENQITVANVVPSFLSYLQPWFSEIHLPHLRYFLSGGERFPEKLAREWQTNCCPQAIVENVYGPTEATIFCHTYRMGPTPLSPNDQSPSLPIGRPMLGVSAIILDNADGIQEMGQPGEIGLYGPQVTPGYWNDPEKTNQAFSHIMLNNREERVYRTGDMGRLNPDGLFEFLGRKDQQVKVDGFRVELGEIEHHAQALSGAKQAVAFSLGDQTQPGGLFLVLEDSKLSAEQLMIELRKAIPVYMIPDEIKMVDSFPVNANGKTDLMLMKQWFPRL